MNRRCSRVCTCFCPSCFRHVSHILPTSYALFLQVDACTALVLKKQCFFWSSPWFLERHSFQTSLTIGSYSYFSSMPEIFDRNNGLFKGTLNFPQKIFLDPWGERPVYLSITVSWLILWEPHGPLDDPDPVDPSPMDPMTSSENVRLRLVGSHDKFRKCSSLQVDGQKGYLCFVCKTRRERGPVLLGLWSVL